MDIKEVVRNALLDDKIKDILGITNKDKEKEKELVDKKIFFLHANNPKAPYIEYEIYDTVNFYACGKVISTDYYIQIDIFSYEDYTEIENIVKNTLEIKEFQIYDGDGDYFEGDTGLYHKAMRFTYHMNKK